MKKLVFRSVFCLAGCFIFILLLFLSGEVVLAGKEQNGQRMRDIQILVDEESVNNGEAERPIQQFLLSDEKEESVKRDMPEISTAYFTPTDLPVLYLSTEGGAPIASKEIYVAGSLSIDGGVSCNCAYRGRGNASWTTYPQKSYLIKLEEKCSLLGLPSSKKWVLRSNYGDPSLVRDAVAAELAFSMDALEFTARTISVDVVLNGRYIGVYQLTEKVEEGKGKVSLFSEEETYPFDASRCLTYGQILAGETYALEPEDTMFLMETSFDFYHEHTYGLEYFKTGHLPNTFISYPEPVAEKQGDITKAIEYMTLVDQAIRSGEQIEEYIDIDSFVDWFIVMELTFNTDSSFNRSTYLYKRPGEKLKIGPVWDFDHAFGNFKFDEPTYHSWCTGEAIYAMCQHHWPDDLLKNDVFMKRVQERFDIKKEELEKLIGYVVEKKMETVASSVSFQSKCYGITADTNPDNLQNFLTMRLEWMDRSLHAENYNRHPATISVNWEPPEDTQEGMEEETILPDLEEVPGQVDETTE